MLLPKGVVRCKDVADELTEKHLDKVNAKVREQEEEIEDLKLRLARARFNLLPEAERRGAENAYYALGGSVFLDGEFYEKYMDYRDEQDKEERRRELQERENTFL